jgi:hypothetical protein
MASLRCVKVVFRGARAAACLEDHTLAPDHANKGVFFILRNEAWAAPQECHAILTRPGPNEAK